MIKFEQGKTYFVKKEGLYELHFECTRDAVDSASFMLVKIVCDTSIGKCPALFSMIQDYYTHFHGEMKKKYITSQYEQGEVREVVFSNYENYLWIDSSNEL